MKLNGNVIGSREIIKLTQGEGGNNIGSREL